MDRPWACPCLILMARKLPGLREPTGQDPFVADFSEGNEGMSDNRCILVSLVLTAALCAVTPASGHAQGNSGKDTGGIVEMTASVALTKDMRVAIQSWYQEHPHGGVEALPPGIRKRLARGKPLPPGIAKQVAPGGLRSQVRLPKGYEIIEVGLDVLLVDVATSIVHDILTDVVR